MKKLPPHLDRNKIYAGVFFLCIGVIFMITGGEEASTVRNMVWIPFFGLGLMLFLWGRFFGRKQGPDANEEEE
jgi:hypothetical protein